MCSLCGGLVRWDPGFTKTRCEDCGAINAEIRFHHMQTAIRPTLWITREELEKLYPRACPPAMAKVSWDARRSKLTIENIDSIDFYRIKP